MPGNNGRTPQPPGPGPLSSGDQDGFIREFLDRAVEWATYVLSHRRPHRSFRSRRRYQQTESHIAEFLIGLAEAWRQHPPSSDN